MLDAAWLDLHGSLSPERKGKGKREQLKSREEEEEPMEIPPKWRKGPHGHVPTDGIPRVAVAK